MQMRYFVHEKFDIGGMNYGDTDVLKRLAWSFVD